MAILTYADFTMEMEYTATPTVADADGGWPPARNDTNSADAAAAGAARAAAVLPSAALLLGGIEGSDSPLAADSLTAALQLSEAAHRSQLERVAQAQAHEHLEVDVAIAESLAEAEARRRRLQQEADDLAAAIRASLEEEARRRREAEELARRRLAAEEEARRLAALTAAAREKNAAVAATVAAPAAITVATSAGAGAMDSAPSAPSSSGTTTLGGRSVGEGTYGDAIGGGSGLLSAGQRPGPTAVRRHSLSYAPSANREMFGPLLSRANGSSTHEEGGGAGGGCTSGPFSAITAALLPVLPSIAAGKGAEEVEGGGRH